RNPLRILDSKDPGDQRVNAEAPEFGTYLTPPARDFFAAVRQGLDQLGLAYRLSPRLVRGLDYYCHTAFEFVTRSLGAQGTVLGGWRYDGLMGLMGGPETPGVGWAAGIERLALLAAAPPPPPRALVVAPLGEAAEAMVLGLAQDLRRAGFTIDLGYSGNLRRRLARADKVNARAAIIIGENELARGAVTVRDLDSGAQAEVPLDRLSEHLASFR
ncbi:MAG: His/Gly/Thr/Pro-type tRNA ligase C-terminal domain-containing protein, partial [Stellaceae bacterium]